jgi:hypothetical protein
LAHSISRSISLEPNLPHIAFAKCPVLLLFQLRQATQSAQRRMTPL